MLISAIGRLVLRFAHDGVQRRRYVMSDAMDADTRRDPHHCRNRLGMLDDIDLLPEQEARVQVVDEYRYAGERLDQVLLNS
jgi:hypothetical protein